MRVVTDSSTGAILLQIDWTNRSLRQVSHAPYRRYSRDNLWAIRASCRARSHHGRPRLST